jgi:hypothetical protein
MQVDCLARWLLKLTGPQQTLDFDGDAKKVQEFCMNSVGFVVLSKLVRPRAVASELQANRPASTVHSAEHLPDAITDLCPANTAIIITNNVSRSMAAGPHRFGRPLNHQAPLITELDLARLEVENNQLKYSDRQLVHLCLQLGRADAEGRPTFVSASDSNGICQTQMVAAASPASKRLRFCVI